MSVKPSIVISIKYGKTNLFGLSRTSDVILNDDGYSKNAKQRLIININWCNLNDRKTKNKR